MEKEDMEIPRHNPDYKEKCQSELYPVCMKKDFLSEFSLTPRRRSRKHSQSEVKNRELCCTPENSNSYKSDPVVRPRKTKRKCIPLSVKSHKRLNFYQNEVDCAVPSDKPSKKSAFSSDSLNADRGYGDLSCDLDHEVGEYLSSSSNASDFGDERVKRELDDVTDRCIPKIELNSQEMSDVESSVVFISTPLENVVDFDWDASLDMSPVAENSDEDSFAPFYSMRRSRFVDSWSSTAISKSWEHPADASRFLSGSDKENVDPEFDCDLRNYLRMKDQLSVTTKRRSEDSHPNEKKNKFDWRLGEEQESLCETENVDFLRNHKKNVSCPHLE